MLPKAKSDRNSKPSCKPVSTSVAQVLSYQPAIATSDTQFRAGSTHLGGYLIDRETQKVICSFALKAHTDDKVDFVYRESGRSKQEALEAWANSTIYENAREQFLKKLASLTGGNFG